MGNSIPRAADRSLHPEITMNTITLDIPFLNTLTEYGFFGVLADADTNNLDFVREVWVDEMTRWGFSLGSAVPADKFALFTFASGEAMHIASHAAKTAQEVSA